MFGPLQYSKIAAQFAGVATRSVGAGRLRFSSDWSSDVAIQGPGSRRFSERQYHDQSTLRASLESVVLPHRSDSVVGIFGTLRNTQHNVPSMSHFCSSSFSKGRADTTPQTWKLLQSQGRSMQHQASDGHPSVSTSGNKDQPGTTAKQNNAAASEETENDKQVPPLSEDVLYEGPLSKSHKILKMVSISNTLIACAAAPAIMTYADISYVSRVGLAASMVLFGLLTTGALHWIAHPYVHELKFQAATQQIDVRTTSLLGRQRWDHFQLSDVQPLPWDRPVATFIAKNRFYYIDVYSFPDKELLKRLTPDESTVPKGYKDDEDD